MSYNSLYLPNEIKDIIYKNLHSQYMKELKIDIYRNYHRINFMDVIEDIQTLNTSINYINCYEIYSTFIKYENKQNRKEYITDCLIYVCGEDEEDLKLYSYEENLNDFYHKTDTLEDELIDVEITPINTEENKNTAYFDIKYSFEFCDKQYSGELHRINTSSVNAILFMNTYVRQKAIRVNEDY